MRRIRAPFFPTPRTAAVAPRPCRASRESLKRGVRAVADKTRPYPGPPHELESRKEPPHPCPLLHRCVEEREMERRARGLEIHARNSSGKSLRLEREPRSRKEPPHPSPLLHKCVEEREMERRARVLGIHARNSSGKSLTQVREPTTGDEARPQPHGEAVIRGREAVIWVRRRRYKLRAARFAGRLTLPGRQNRELTDGAPGESNQIKPNQSCGDGWRASKSMVVADVGREGAARCMRGACAPREQEIPVQLSTNLLLCNGLQDFRCVRPGQAKSRPVKPSQTGSNLREWGHET
jgi:hypothetical protein